MSTKHTPGPWQVIVRPARGTYELLGDNWPTVDERTANACLIEAAPALLATLERIANSCEEFATDPQCDADPYDLCEAMAQDARAAIAAARGEG